MNAFTEKSGNESNEADVGLLTSATMLFLFFSIFLLMYYFNAKPNLYDRTVLAPDVGEERAPTGSASPSDLRLRCGVVFVSMCRGDTRPLYHRTNFFLIQTLNNSQSKSLQP